jgi:hypothetical protein
MALRDNSIYAYTDLSDAQIFVKTSDLTDLLDWSPSTTYSTRNAAFYAGAYYVCLTANTNAPPVGNVSEEWSVLVLVRDGSSQNHTANEAYALAETALETAVEVGQQGSNYSFEIFVAGTNYSNTQGGAAFVAQQGSQYSTILRDQGTNFALGQVAIEATARVAGDLITAQQGSELAYDLYWAGTNYSNSQGGATLVAQQGSQYATILRDQGTNYTDSRIAVETAARIDGDVAVAQHGSELAYDLYWAGTNYTNSQMAVEVVTRSTADQAETTARIFGDGTTLAAAKAYADSIAGTNTGSVVAYNFYIAGTNYTNSQFAVAVQNGSQYATILRDQGTNFSVSQTAVETSARVAADIVVAQHGSELAYDLFWAGTNYSNSQGGAALVGQQGSQYATILRDQGTNFTLSQVAIEVSARTAADIVVAQHGSELAFDLYWQGTNSTAGLQLSDAGVANDGAGLSTARVGSNLPVKRIKAGTNIAIESNGTNVKIGIDTLNTTQTSWVGPSVGQAGVAVYAGTVTLDFGSQAYSTITLAGNLYIIPTGMQPGRGVSARLIGDTVDRTLDFAGGVRFIGTRPTTLAANKIAVVSFSSYSTDLSNVVGAYSAET